MNYNHLLYFSVLADTQHYTQAATRLGISQPSLSNAIHNLEADLGGIRLFEKEGRNIRLTEAGQYYHQKVNAALKELDLASNVLMRSQEDAPIVIRLGVVSGSLNGTAADEIEKYLKENPRIRFQINESSAENLMTLLRKEKLDMAIVDSTSRDPSLHFRILCKKPLFVAIPKSHPLSSRKDLRPEDIADLPQIVFNYQVKNSFAEWASKSVGNEHIICQVNTAQAALDLVAAGIGIAFIPDSCLMDHENVNYILLENWYQALYMCILYDKWLEPSIWQFREVLTNAMRAHARK